MIIATNPPIVSAISPSKVIFLTELIINKPTNTNAGVVAKPGIAKNIGERNNAIANNTAVVTAVRPVRPPCATPALLST